MASFGKISKLSQIEVKKQIENGDDIVILDVRAPHEFASGHIKGAINMPFECVPTQILELVKNKEQMIFVNCLSGARSRASAAIIKSKGYINVYDIGGVTTWKYGLYED